MFIKFITFIFIIDFSIHSRFFVVALTFFYGTRLVSTLEFSYFEFFVGLMVRAL